MCKNCQRVYKTAAGLSCNITQKPPPSSSEKKYYNKLESSRFFKKLSTLEKDKCYPEYIRSQFKTLMMDNMQANNNLYEDALVIYGKLTKISNPEKIFNGRYGKIVLESERYVGVKNPHPTLITSKIAEKLFHYFKVVQQDGESSSSSSSKAEQYISLSERELHGLQYHTGNIISNLMKSAKNNN